MTVLNMVLLLLFSVALIVAEIQLFRFQKQLTVQQRLLRKLSSELNATSNGCIGLGHRISLITKQLNTVKSQHQDLLAFGSSDQQQKRTYKQATHLAQMGASIEELRESCELSQGEAELLSHMNLN